MKTNHISKILFFVLTIILFSNCSKERTIKKDDKNAYGSLAEFYSLNRPPEQEFTITQDGTGPIVGIKGTQLWVNKNIFMHQDGSDVEYPFIIKLVELYSASDMILYNTPSVSYNRLLNCIGEIRVKAYKNGEELKLKPYSAYNAFMPSTNLNSNMEIYYGYYSSGHTEWTNNLASIDATPNIENVAQISIGTYGYNLTIPRLGWSSVAYYNNYIMYRTSCVFSSKTDNLTNIDKFIVSNTRKSVMQVYGNISGELPMGENVKIICIGITTDKKMYYYTTTITLIDNNPVDVKMSEITKNNLIDFLNNL